MSIDRALVSRAFALAILANIIGGLLVVAFLEHVLRRRERA